MISAGAVLSALVCLHSPWKSSINTFPSLDSLRWSMGEFFRTWSRVSEIYWSSGAKK